MLHKNEAVSLKIGMQFLLFSKTFFFIKVVNNEEKPSGSVMSIKSDSMKYLLHLIVIKSQAK